MKRQTLYVAAAAAAALAVVVFTATAAGGGSGKGKGGKGGHGQLISESSMLSGLPSNALFPFIDTTPHRITQAHIAVTDSTASCSAGAAPPANIQVLVGQAGVALVNVMTASTNTGIGTPAQCVFHVTVRPRRGGVPATVTDIVVKNAGAAPLTGINTVTASATVNARRGGD
jgi:hypothetical protein